jgi:hypothetical protein
MYQKGKIFIKLSVVVACTVLMSKHKIGKNRGIDNRTFLVVQVVSLPIISTLLGPVL